MHKKLRAEVPGKVLPPLPRKNRSHSTYNGGDDDDSDADSMSSVSTEGLKPSDAQAGGGIRSYLPFGGGSHRRSQSKSSPSASPRGSLDASQAPHARSGSVTSYWFGSPSLTAPRTPSVSGSSIGGEKPHHVLHREEQRVSLRASLRNFLRNPQIAGTRAMTEFLTADPTTLTEDEVVDVKMRMEMDEKRIEEQRRFYEIARQRARELDVHMEKFRRDIVESSQYSSD